MSISPIITFKAGKCDIDSSSNPPRIKPISTPGFLYLYNEEDLVHFCWRPRSASLADPELDLIMVPTDGTFQPYLGPNKNSTTSPVNGRIFALKFSSSSQRHFFWLQSREQPRGQPNKFSPRDLRLGQIVDDLLQGNEVDTSSQIASLRNQDHNGDNDDTNMDDAPPPDSPDLNRTASGGAGPDATGGDVREEGEEAREGGADGGRAHSSVSHETDIAVQNFLNSLKGSGQSQNQLGMQQDKLFATLSELMPPSTTVPMVDLAESSFIEELLVQHLPPSLVFLEHEVDDAGDTTDQETLRVSTQALEAHQQKNIVKRVLHSPQFSQGLATLTSAIRDGGLPMISEALHIPVENGGYTGSNRRVPLSGGAAVDAFLEGVKQSVQQE